MIEYYEKLHEIEKRSRLIKEKNTRIKNNLDGIEKEFPKIFIMFIFAIIFIYANILLNMAATNMIYVLLFSITYIMSMYILSKLILKFASKIEKDLKLDLEKNKELEKEIIKNKNDLFYSINKKDLQMFLQDNYYNIKKEEQNKFEYLLNEIEDHQNNHNRLKKQIERLKIVNNENKNEILNI